MLCISCEKLDLEPQDNDQKEKNSISNSSPKKPSSGSSYDVEANNADSPWSIADILSGRFLEAFENPDSIKNVTNAYVTGYIVGYVNGTTINQAKFGYGETETNIILADYVNENDKNCCLPVQLVRGTYLQTTLNLHDHPGLIGCRFILCGTLTDYMGTIGLKQLKSKENVDDEGKYKDNNNNNYDDNDNDDEDDNEVDSGYAVYSVRDIINRTISGTKWINGYIVGYLPFSAQKNKRNIVFDTPATASDKTNIAIADSENERNPDNCILVKLTQDSKTFDSRSGLNLYDNPDNMHRQVHLLGHIDVYIGSIGIDRVDAYELP